MAANGGTFYGEACESGGVSARHSGAPQASPEPINAVVPIMLDASVSPRPTGFMGSGLSLRSPRNDGDRAMTNHFPMLAAYNAWANRRVYEAAAKLPHADYRADRSAFFKSVHGTLNHLLVADRLWMRRFTGEGEVADRLDAILFEGLGDLRGAREAEDARIIRYVEGLSQSDLDARLRYRTISNPGDVEQPLAPALVHFFNHQTHHRGQVHALLTGLVGDAPSLDLIAFQRETGIGSTEPALVFGAQTRDGAPHRHGPAMPRTIDYYFSLVSPWAFIGHAPFMDIARRHGCAVNYKPVALGTVFAQTGGIAPQPAPSGAAALPPARASALAREDAGCRSTFIPSIGPSTSSSPTAP
jgi:uncharacterized damage-inducible protein DinB